MKKPQVSDYVDLCVKSIFAGILISLGCCGYAMSGNVMFGAVLFSIGLLTIKQSGMKLFTGVIGRFTNVKEFVQCIIVLGFNLVGSLFIGLLIYCVSGPLYNNIAEIGASKSAHTNTYLFLMAIACGFIMYFATKKDIGEIQTILCVALFIIAGFEHSIADGLYLLIGANSFLNYLSEVLIIAFGNAIGANIASRGLREVKLNKGVI